MQTYPKISIITPSFNQGEYLEKTILSVLDQGYPNLEYIIIDGGSTDSSIEIIKKYEGEINFWVSEQDNGMYHALQKGFDKSTGEIMGWINSDDVLAPRSLFTAAEIFNDYAIIEWLGGIPNNMDESGRIIATGIMPRWNKYRYLQLDYKYIQQEGIFWKRSLWLKAGSSINTNLRLAADLELWSRFFSHAELHFVSGILGTFRVRRSNQKTLELMEEYNKEAIKVLDEMHRTKKDAKNIQQHRSLFWKILRSNRLFNYLSRFLGFMIERDPINEYPRSLYFDRFSQKYILK